MITRKLADNRLQLLYDGKPVKGPYVYGITVANTGAYAVTNEDFKDEFSIDFSGCNQVISVQIVKSSNGAVLDEVLSNSKLDGSRLIVSDFYLNTEESFEIYLIVDGRPDSITYHSRISGISKLTLRNTPKEKRDTSLHYMILIASIGILIVITCATYVFWQNKKIMQEYAKLSQEKLEKSVGSK